MAAVLDSPMGADPFVPALRHLVEAEEIQKTTSVVCAQSPVAGARLQTVRSNRSTVLISSSQGVSRNQALAGNTVKFAGLPAIAARGLGLGRPARLAARYAQFKPRRKLGWLSLTWVSR